MFSGSHSPGKSIAPPGAGYSSSKPRQTPSTPQNWTSYSVPHSSSVSLRPDLQHQDSNILGSWSLIIPSPSLIPYPRCWFEVWDIASQKAFSQHTYLPEPSQQLGAQCLLLCLQEKKRWIARWCAAGRKLAEYKLHFLGIAPWAELPRFIFS